MKIRLLLLLIIFLSCPVSCGIGVSRGAARERIIIEGQDLTSPNTAYEYVRSADTKPFSLLRTTGDIPGLTAAPTVTVYSPFSQPKELSAYRPQLDRQAETAVDEFSTFEFFLFSLGVGLLILLAL